MGLLDRWVKKKTAEQLNRDSDVSRAISDEKNSEQKLKKTKIVESKKVTRKGSVVKKQPKKSTSKKSELKEEDNALKPTLKTVEGVSYRVIVEPLITEKGTLLQTYNQYVFKVERSAQKKQVARAVQELYGVAPQAVRFINVQGKQIRFGRHVGRRGDFKKAIVTLPKGSQINIHEAV